MKTRGAPAEEPPFPAPQSVPARGEDETGISSRTPTLTDWAMMLGVAVLGGSAFAAIKIAVGTAPPPVVSAVRLWFAFGFMLIYALSTGRRPMPLRVGGRFNRAWAYAAAVGFVGYAAPLTLIPWAQQSVSSLVAGITISFMPIATVIFAALFADEPLTRRKAFGFLGGTIGVIFLIGPAAIMGAADAALVPQLVLLLSVTGYAAANVLMRRAPDVPARSFAAGFLLLGALMATPAALYTGFDGVSMTSWLAIAYLGIVPTGLAAVFIILTVRRVGAGFLSMSAYLSPVTAIILGILLFGEALEVRHLLGLLAILCGIALAEPSGLSAARAYIRGRWRRADK